MKDSKTEDSKTLMITYKLRDPELIKKFEKCSKDYNLSRAALSKAIICFALVKPYLLKDAIESSVLLEKKGADNV